MTRRYLNDRSIAMLGCVKKSRDINLIGAQKRSGFVATLLTLTAFGHAKARRDSLRESLNLHLHT